MRSNWLIIIVIKIKLLTSSVCLHSYWIRFMLVLKVVFKIALLYSQLPAATWCAHLYIFFISHLPLSVCVSDFYVFVLCKTNFLFETIQVKLMLLCYIYVCQIIIKVLEMQGMTQVQMEVVMASRCLFELSWAHVLHFFTLYVVWFKNKQL